jgi:hypothetical protein
MSFTPREPKILNLGLPVFHDMRCCVAPGEPAVYRTNDGVFLPSWKAQGEGWKLVRARNWFQRWILRAFFEFDPHA